VLDDFCCEAAYACQQQPAKNHQRNGNFIAMKLRQKLSDGKQLRGNRGYACADNRPDNEPLNVHTYLPQQKNRSL